MKNRLDYETKGGELSEALTYEQLLEHLRLAQECCFTIGHYRKAQDDQLLGQGWLAIGEMLKMTEVQVGQLATRRLHSSIGFKQ